LSTGRRHGREPDTRVDGPCSRPLVHGWYKDTCVLHTCDSTFEKLLMLKANHYEPQW